MQGLGPAMTSLRHFGSNVLTEASRTITAPSCRPRLSNTLDSLSVEDISNPFDPMDMLDIVLLLPSISDNLETLILHNALYDYSAAVWAAYDPFNLPKLKTLSVKGHLTTCGIFLGLLSGLRASKGPQTLPPRVAIDLGLGNESFEIREGNGDRQLPFRWSSTGLRKALLNLIDIIPIAPQSSCSLTVDDTSMNLVLLGRDQASFKLKLTFDEEEAYGFTAGHQPMLAQRDGAIAYILSSLHQRHFDPKSRTAAVDHLELHCSQLNYDTPRKAHDKIGSIIWNSITTAKIISLAGDDFEQEDVELLGNEVLSTAAVAGNSLELIMNGSRFIALPSTTSS